MLSKYLTEDYNQEPNDNESLAEVIQDRHFSDETILKNIYVFVVSSNAYSQGSYIWVNTPIGIHNITIQPDKYKLDQSERPTFRVNLVGWEINDTEPISVWSDRTYDDNVEVILKELPQSKIPYRTDKNTAIVEANDINFLIGEVQRSTRIPINLVIQVWSIYEVFQHIKPTMFGE